MIYGLGCDITEISRIEQVFGTRDRILRIFTEKEADLFFGRPERIAGNFCAKEAFAKALGTGFRGFSLKDVEILRDELGRPYVTGDSLRRVLEQVGVHERLKVHISISHEKKFAMATCVLERVKL